MSNQPHTRKARPGELSDVFGKVQPQAVELEEAVLGALMLDREALSIVSDILKPETFYLEAHQHIYRAILSLNDKQRPVDLLTVTEEMRKAGKIDAIGGAFYLTELTNRVASAANIEYHARIIAQKWIQRELIRITGIIQRQAYEDVEDAFDLVSESERMLFALTSGTGSADALPAATVAMQVVTQAETAMQRSLEGGVSGVPTGFTPFDKETGGLHAPDLIVIAGRPGMGKSSWAMSVGFNAATLGNSVAVFSLEMSATQLMSRILAGQTGIPSNLMVSGKMQDNQLLLLQDAAGNTEGLPMWIDETPRLSLSSFRAKARRLKMKHDIKLIIVDYIQLMTDPIPKAHSTTEEEISRISKGLKMVCKELNVPIIVLSQLSRAVEIRGGSKRPILSDLRGSGSIEQDADIVGFLYRPEYYGIMEDESGQNLAGIAELGIEKHRQGKAPCRLRLKFTEEFALFSDLETSTQFPTTPRTEGGYTPF